MCDGFNSKLYTHKPKKAQLKQALKQKPLATTTSTASMASVFPQKSVPSPPPQPPIESFARRMRFAWPLLLAVNLSIGAYLFIRTKKKDTRECDAVPHIPSTAAISTVTTASNTDK